MSIVTDTFDDPPLVTRLSIEQVVAATAHLGGNPHRPDVIDRIVAMGGHDGGIRFRRIASETNGVGAMPTEQLRRLAAEARVCDNVEGMTTTLSTKEDGFGAVRLLLQEGRLVLPRHASLLRQLANLEHEHLDSGSMWISVPSSWAMTIWR